MKIAKTIVSVIGAIISGITFYLLAVALAPGFPKPVQNLTSRMPRRDDGDGERRALRSTVSFDVDGSTIRAWFYPPADSSGPAPCIVMAHGLGGTKAMGLDGYAARFQAAGYAALVFDYRGWGESDGEPRGLIWIPNQLEDYAAAVEYARSRAEIDPLRIALWGTSFSGGHALVTAAQDPGVACVIAQCPGLDGREAMEMAFRRTGLDLRIVAHAQRDLVRSWLGRSPHKIPVVGKPGDVALLTTPDALTAFERLAPADYVNEACARIAIRGDKYRPVQQAHSVRCPILLQVCEEDELVPVQAVDRAAEILGELAQVKRYPIGHFAIYSPEHFTISVNDQIDFLSKQM